MQALLTTLALIFTLGPWRPCAAADRPDLAREQRLADETADAILDGEPLYLRADGWRFLAIHTEPPATESKGAVIVLHGRGLHPNWPQVTYPLRTGLPARGWTTLSLQMPVLEKGARYYDYKGIFPASFARIEAGIDFLKQRGATPIVLIAHSCSVHMSMAWFNAGRGAGIDAYVGIGMGATDLGQPMREPLPLARLAIPVLDLYGGEDYGAVRKEAPRRKAALQHAGHPLSRQRVIPGANHDFVGRDAALLEAVASWLETVAAAQPAKHP